MDPVPRIIPGNLAGKIRLRVDAARKQPQPQDHFVETVLAADHKDFLSQTLRCMGEVVPPTATIGYTCLGGGKEQVVYEVGVEGELCFVLKIDIRKPRTTLIEENLFSRFTNFTEGEFCALKFFNALVAGAAANAYILENAPGEDGPVFFYSQERLSKTFQQLHPYYRVAESRWALAYRREDGVDVTLGRDQTRRVVQTVVNHVFTAHLCARQWRGLFFVPMPSYAGGDIMAEIKGESIGGVKWVGCLNALVSNIFATDEPVEVVRTAARSELGRTTIKPIMHYTLNLSDEEAVTEGIREALVALG